MKPSSNQGHEHHQTNVVCSACIEVCLRWEASQVVGIVLPFQHLLASYTIAPLKVLRSKFGPAYLLWCSLWILPDVYRFFSARQHLGGLPSWLWAQCPQMASSSISSKLFSLNHTLVFTESQSAERTVCLSYCVWSSDSAHTPSRPVSVSAVGFGRWDILPLTYNEYIQN